MSQPQTTVAILTTASASHARISVNHDQPIPSEFALDGPGPFAPNKFDNFITLSKTKFT